MSEFLNNPPLTGGQPFWNYVRDLGALVKVMFDNSTETAPEATFIAWPRSETIAAGATVQASYSIATPVGYVPVAILVEQSTANFGTLHCTVDQSGSNTVVVSLKNTGTTGKTVSPGSTRILVQMAGTLD